MSDFKRAGENTAEYLQGKPWGMWLDYLGLVEEVSQAHLTGEWANVDAYFVNVLRTTASRHNE